jgi:hypothetical protein
MSSSEAERRDEIAIGGSPIQQSAKSCAVCGVPLNAGSGDTLCPVCSLRSSLDPESAHADPENDLTVAEPAGTVEEPSPRRFGHYEIATRPDGTLHELGHGAIGITFKAIDVNLRIPVTLKVLNKSRLASVFSGRPESRRRCAIPTSHRFIISECEGAKCFMRWNL